MTYLVSGLNIFFSMSCLYWASQYIPSGWMSVLYGLSPIMTGVLATALLGENALLPHKLFGMVLGLIGLTIIFGQGHASGQCYVYGVIAVLLSTFSHSLSSVLVKRLRAGLSGVAATTGGLSVATPLFLLAWYMIEDGLPQSLAPRAVYAIIYLGAFASTAGFAMYYYILTRMEVGKVSLITLVTPVSALILGNLFNNEPVSMEVILGAGFIVTGLLAHEYGRILVRLVFRMD
jgi:drug/metabolite transporter (DMT)-like permease